MDVESPAFVVKPWPARCAKAMPCTRGVSPMSATTLAVAPSIDHDVRAARHVDAARRGVGGEVVGAAVAADGGASDGEGLGARNGGAETAREERRRPA